MQVSDQPATGVPGMQPYIRLVDGQAANAADAALALCGHIVELL